LGAGAGALTIISSGTGYIPSGQSTYSGGTILSAGSTTIPLSSSTGPAGAPTSGPLGTGTLNLAGGSIRSTTASATTIGNPVTISANTTFLTANPEKDLTFTGPVTLTGSRMLTVNTGSTVA